MIYSDRNGVARIYDYYGEYTAGNVGQQLDFTSYQRFHDGTRTVSKMISSYDSATFPHLRELSLLSWSVLTDKPKGFP